MSVIIENSETSVNQHGSSRHAKDFLRMFISYIDESLSGAQPDASWAQGFQVIGGPIIDGDQYTDIEYGIDMGIWGLLNERKEEFESFEFHASKLFNAAPPFDKLGLDKCRQLLEAAVHTVKERGLPIVYGAVDMRRLAQEVYCSADPVDMAFRMYMKSLKTWIGQPRSQTEWVGVIIADDSGSKSSVRKTLTETFHKMRSVPKKQIRHLGHPPPLMMASMRLLDDIYFSDSRRSIGVQLADVCAYFIGHRLAGRLDSEPFYEVIRDQIVEHSIYPEVPKGVKL